MTDPAPGTPTGPALTAALIEAWADGMADLREVVASLGEDGWRHPSLLPGWSVADVVAHLAWIERILLGRFDPPHEPDWAALPHVGTELSRATEVPVDLRRSRSRAEVLAEFDETVADRHAALQAGSQDPAEPATNPFGKRVTLEAVLRMRTFDTWVHGQDVRLAVGHPGATATPAARVAAEQIAGALGFVWAKRVDAPVGTSLLLEVTPPGVALRRAVLRAEGGAGVAVEPPADPTVTLTMAFDDFVQLGCGRTRPDSSTEQARSRVRVAGDPGLGALAVERFNIAP
ncbi:MAG: maleylpyruvate isomerase family mycothiol-dependent enzyme [Candidatus Nanopelagicales bacterium]|jgi:uncharacterized protein (TIGR03083 family)|nr:maleylpyruvate isomerase family mycothiol-dependent enzyme [Candidatus Nanopelagicales bacterium]